MIKRPGPEIGSLQKDRKPSCRRLAILCASGCYGFMKVLAAPSVRPFIPPVRSVGAVPLRGVDPAGHNIKSYYTLLSPPLRGAAPTGRSVKLVIGVLYFLPVTEIVELFLK